MKRQVNVPGGLRKVIETGGPTASPGTTIAELGATTVSLAQLKALLAISTPTGQSSSGSGTSTAALLAGAGLLGGGPIIGAVPLYLAQSTPPVIWNEDLLPDEFIGGASSGANAGISITDGTNAVNNSVQVTFSGATVSGATPNATVTVTPNGNAFSGSTPETIPNLIFWWEANFVPLANGSVVQWLNSPDINFIPVYATCNNNVGATLVTSATNGKSAVSFSTSGNTRYTLSQSPSFLASGTVLCVMKPSAAGVLLGGPTGSLGVRIATSGSNFVIGTARNGTNDFGTSTGTMSSSAWHQFNVTVNGGTNAITYRVDKAVGGTGTVAAAITASSTTVGYNASSGAEDLGAQIAAILVYNRVLTGGEITSLETYFARYGV